VHRATAQGFFSSLVLAVLPTIVTVYRAVTTRYTLCLADENQTGGIHHFTCLAMASLLKQYVINPTCVATFTAVVIQPRLLLLRLRRPRQCEPLFVGGRRWDQPGVPRRRRS